MKEVAAIIDIDGVLCHVGWDCEPHEFNWQEFAEKDLQREILWEGVYLAHVLTLRGTYPVFLTARHEGMRQQTADFLRWVGFDDFELVMTSTGACDDEAHEKYQEHQAMSKKAALEKLVDRYKFIYAIDDQEPNCKIYREFGIPTLKAMFTDEEFIRAGNHE